MRPQSKAPPATMGGAPRRSGHQPNPLARIPQGGDRPKEPTLDDALEEARRARDEGATNAELSLHTGWRLWAEHELDRLIASGDTFSADDLRAVCGAPPDGEHVNGIGGLFLRARKQGRIVLAGSKESVRPEAHGRLLRVWRGAS